MRSQTVSRVGLGPSRAAGLVWKQPRNLRIDEGLEKTDTDRENPDQPRRSADRRRNTADGEQDQRRYATGDPKRALLTDPSLHFRHEGCIPSPVNRSWSDDNASRSAL